MKINTAVFLTFFCIFFLVCSGNAQSHPSKILFQNKKNKDRGPTKADTAELKKFKDLLSGIASKKTKELRKIMPKIVNEGLAHKNADVYVLCHKALKDSNNEMVYKVLADFIKKKKCQNTYALGGSFDILRHSNDPKNWEACLKYLNDKHRGVGTLATELAGQGLREAVPVLMKNLKKLNMRRLTITLAVLNYLTGQNHNYDVTYFENWWELNKKDFVKDISPLSRSNGVIEYYEVKRTTSSSYHGQKLDMANTMFCMDTSNSMKPDKPLDKPKEGKDYLKGDDVFPPLPEGDGYDSKIWMARKELAAAIKNLNKRMSFGIVTFGGQIDAWKGGELYPAKDIKNKVDAYKWVLYETPLSLGTWLFQSVAIALGNPDTEVIYLLTDGAPAPLSMNAGPGRGSIKLKAGSDIMSLRYFDSAYIKDLAYREFHSRRIRIHCILVGGDGRAAKKGDPLLRSIAKVTKASFKSVEKIEKQSQ